MISEWMDPTLDKVRNGVMRVVGDGERGPTAPAVDDPDEDLGADLGMVEEDPDLVGWFE